ncbi:RNA 2',3'-cyclic phosphodiesterase [Qipengyuania soli]|uniref:RNA 2',3'-cyclic phosphodiesterase n=1 Tax=Qipengyuania soli TaxID=2782568 RepID=A0A7S8IUI1_9SPHN|nr:RNA 2',3'-cyclic phosphodiesterase [Qipengyuania soli]QPC97771.1 RNA 2',3'-cyclic phosphodiesterase [Qipengyuania soli]
MVPRLFIAIRPPHAIRNALLDAMQGVERARWQDDGQLHLTLRFLGETDHHRANDLASALASVSASPFALSVRGSGIFERKGTVHTLWAGVEPSEPLQRLQARIERVCQQVGFAPETRKFVPHITLARLNASAGPLAQFLARTGDLRFGEWTVDDFRLYESHLDPGGARYEPVVRYPLA